MFLPNRQKKGFTLIELLVVIGILTVLFGIVLVAINPAKQFSQANDTQRRSDVNAILNAIHQYAADNKGTIPAGISTSSQDIASTGGVNLCSVLVPTYLADLPIDPKTGTKTPSSAVCTSATSYDTKYNVIESSASGAARITVSAQSEVDPASTISVTR